MTLKLKPPGLSIRSILHHISGVSLSMGESCCCGRVKEEWREPESTSPPPVFRDIQRVHSPAGEASGEVDALTPKALVFKDQTHALRSFEQVQDDALENKHGDDAEQDEASEKDAVPWAEDEKHMLEEHAVSQPLGKQTSQASTASTSADDVNDWARSRLPTLIGDPDFGTARWGDAEQEGVSSGSHLEDID